MSSAESMEYFVPADEPAGVGPGGSNGIPGLVELAQKLGVSGSTDSGVGIAGGGEDGMWYDLTEVLNAVVDLVLKQTAREEEDGAEYKDFMGGS